MIKLIHGTDMQYRVARSRPMPNELEQRPPLLPQVVYTSTTLALRAQNELLDAGYRKCQLAPKDPGPKHERRVDKRLASGKGNE